MSETWTFKTWDGEEYSLMLTGDDPSGLTYYGRYQLLKGARGHHGMPVTFTADRIPYKDGEEIGEEYRPPRELYMPMRIQGKNPSEFTANKNKIRRSFNPRKQLQLWITNEQGDTRVFYGRYQGGFDEAVDDWTRAPTWISIPLKVICHDPYCYDIPGNEIEHTVGFTVPTVPYFDANPWFSNPWRLGNSSVDNTWNIVNDGDFEAYPIWTVTGPGSAPYFENVTTGKYLALNYTLAEGEQIIIDTRENTHTVEGSTDGWVTSTNLRKYLDKDMRDWFPLEVGSNEITVLLRQGSTGGSAVSFSFLKRFEGV